VLHSLDPARGGRYLTRDDPSGFAAPPAFGPFRVLHQIGVGALGPVFRTYEPTRDRLVAVKIFRLDLTPEQSTALADELARATEAGLFHASIVEPLAAGVEGTVAYRADEYVAAESLDVAMRHYAPATVEKALPFITQLASAIDFARAAGVGHGALHPRDIFVTPDEARASGFGVVDALERLGIRAPVRRPYSSPERIAGKPWSTAADVFSLGAIAFELLTGRRPSGLGDQMGALTGASLGAREEQIRSVLARAMAEEPDARYSSAAAFVSALADAAAVATPAVPIAAATQDAAVTPEPAPQANVAEPTPEVVEAVPQASEADNAREVAAVEVASLDDFAPESTTPGPGDSTREMARKVIAARKRQHKAKPAQERSVFDPPPETLPITAAEALAGDFVAAARDAAPGEQPADRSIAEASEPLAAANESREVQAIAATGHSDTDEVAPPPEEVHAAPLQPLIASRADTLRADAPLEFVAPVDSRSSQDTPGGSLDEIALRRDAADATAASAEIDRSIEKKVISDSAIPGPAIPAAARPEPAITGRATPGRLVPDTPTPDERPGGFEPELATDDNVRELVTESLKADASADRVVAVDEFRAREVAAGRAERPRQRGLLDRGVPRVVPSPATDSGVHDSLLSSNTEPETARERFAMLPVAIGLLIGLLIGFGGGYFVGNRERAVPSVVENTPRTELATPGTSGQSPSAGDTEQRVNPTTGSAPPVPSGRPATARPSSAAPAARPSSAPASGPAGAKPTSAVKPSPKAPAAKTVPPAAARRGQMVITSEPARASVTVDGKWTGRTPLTLDNRRFGSYRIRVVREGYEVASTTLTISDARPSATFAPTLTAIPASPRTSAAAPKPAARAPAAAATKPGAAAAKPTAKTGEIFVDSRPQGATVLVDGKAVGVTPLRLTSQPAGSHTVRLELADHQPWTSTATVIGGQTARVTGSMERIR
jgi:protein kinase-like protein/PEGA domain-containing protein